MASLYVLTAVGSVIAAPFILLHIFRFPKFSTERVKTFLQKMRNGVCPIAHRGGRPENTLGAIRKSKEEGAGAVEVDLQFTKDGYPILLHDPTVDRTSNGRGAISELTFEEVRKLDFGIKHGAEFAGERIPTLYEAVDLCEELDLQLFLDIKGDSQKSLHELKKLFGEQPHLYNRVAVVSFWPQFLYQIRSANPEIVIGLAWRSFVLQTYPDGRPRHSEWWKHLLSGMADRLLFWSIKTWIWRLLGISLGLPFKNDILEKRTDVRKWMERDISIVIWTVNKTEEKEYFREVLHLPFMTDSCSPEQAVPEQTC